MPIYRTMTELATESIKDGILRGRYKPGARLMPDKLEKEFNLGKMAIREALRELAGCGLVTFHPNKGTSVAQIVSVDEIREIFEIRFLLEPKAAELATPNITTTTLLELETLDKDMSTVPLSPIDFFFLNKDFHLKIYHASGWSYLCSLIEQLLYRVQNFRNIYHVQSSDLKWFTEEHSKILEALRQRKPKLVSRLILTNITKGYQSLERDFEVRKGSGRHLFDNDASA